MANDLLLLTYTALPYGQSLKMLVSAMYLLFVTSGESYDLFPVPDEYAPEAVHCLSYFLKRKSLSSFSSLCLMYLSL